MSNEGKILCCMFSVMFAVATLCMGMAAAPLFENPAHAGKWFLLAAFVLCTLPLIVIALPTKGK